MTANEYVDPYKYIGMLDISNDVAKYGCPISVYAWSKNGASAPVHIWHNGYSYYEIKTLSTGSENVAAIVVFVKNIVAG